MSDKRLRTTEDRLRILEQELVEAREEISRLGKTLNKLIHSYNIHTHESEENK